MVGSFGSTPDAFTSVEPLSSGFDIIIVIMSHHPLPRRRVDMHAYTYIQSR